MKRLDTFRLYVAGRPIDLWEDPERPFGCGEADLQRYLYRGHWVLLFNAMALSGERPESDAGS